MPKSVVPGLINSSRKRTRENDDWSRAQLPPRESRRPVRSRAVHFDILEAIRSHYASAAARCMRQHLKRDREVYIRDEIEENNLIA